MMNEMLNGAETAAVLDLINQRLNELNGEIPDMRPESREAKYFTQERDTLYTAWKKLSAKPAPVRR